jgi:hypothetical protein
MDWIAILQQKAICFNTITRPPNLFTAKLESVDLLFLQHV